jgi:hypothetical protein
MSWAGLTSFTQENVLPEQILSRSLANHCHQLAHQQLDELELLLLVVELGSIPAVGAKPGLWHGLQAAAQQCGGFSCLHKSQAKKPSSKTAGGCSGEHVWLACISAGKLAHSRQHPHSADGGPTGKREEIAPRPQPAMHQLICNSMSTPQGCAPPPLTSCLPTAAASSGPPSAQTHRQLPGRRHRCPSFAALQAQADI